MVADTVGITEALFRYNNWNQKNLRKIILTAKELKVREAIYFLNKLIEENQKKKKVHN